MILSKKWNQLVDQSMSEMFKPIEAQFTQKYSCLKLHKAYTHSSDIPISNNMHGLRLDRVLVCEVPSSMQEETLDKCLRVSYAYRMIGG